MPAFSIRVAVLEDAGILANLGVQTFLETFEPLYDPKDLAAYLSGTYGETIQRAELADPARPALVLEMEGVPSGFAQLRLDHREPGIPGVRPAELQRIYLLRRAQDAGRGAALMAASVDLGRVRGADALWLGVWEHNLKALAFYARCGFREVGEHSFSIGQRIDRDLILVKEPL